MALMNIIYWTTKENKTPVIHSNLLKKTLNKAALTVLLYTFYDLPAHTLLPAQVRKEWAKYELSMWTIHIQAHLLTFYTACIFFYLYFFIYLFKKRDRPG